jgi:signal transduction histidine kinase
MASGKILESETVSGEREVTELLLDTLRRSSVFRMALAGSLGAFTFSIYTICGKIPPLELVGVLVFEAFLNQPFPAIVRLFNDKLLRFLYLQLTFDILVITVFLHYAGGIEALLLNSAYYLPIVFVGVLVSTNLSFYAAALSSIAYGTLVFGELLGWIPHISTFGLQMSLPHQFLFVCVSIFFFNFTGYFTSYPARMLRDHRRELAKTKGELEQWNVRLSHRMDEKTEELQSTYEKLVDSEKLAVLGQFAAGLTHEIDNPLTIIAGRAESLLLRGGLDAKVEQALQTIMKQARRASEMTAQLLSVSRPMQLEFESLDLNTLLDETIEGVGFRPEFDRVDVAKHFDRGLSSVQADRKRLIEVFSNLMNNAAQSMLPDGGHMTVSSRAKAESVLVDITDTGPGIGKENIAKLFTPFFTTKEVGKGTGLGLFVSHGIIKKHGGRIQVDSEVGRGTTVTIMLPLHARGGRSATEGTQASS